MTDSDTDQAILKWGTRFKEVHHCYFELGHVECADYVQTIAVLIYAGDPYVTAAKPLSAQAIATSHI